MRRFLKKRYILGLIAVLVIGSIVYGATRPKVDSSIQTDVVKSQNLKQTVLATGQVTSTTDLSLAFKSSGIVRLVNVKVGQQVKIGQILANLDARDVAASLTSARGTYAQAQANYRKVLDGASSEDVQVAQASVNAAQVRLDNAKKSSEVTRLQQDTLVSNAQKALYNSTFEAVPDPSNYNTSTVAISGSYNSSIPGSYRIIQEGKSFYVQGLETRGNIDLNTSVQVPHPLGTRGLYVQFPNDLVVSKDKWTVEVPNTKASNYITNLNAYNAALESKQAALNTAEAEVNNAQIALDQAKASLDLKKAQARPADVAAAQAQITSALGQVQAAEANLENTIIRAPSNGTITTVDVKVGEQSAPGTTAIVLQDVDSLHIEANVSEANIASIKEGQPVNFTFDSLGPDRIFNGAVQLIDPASTVVSGVVNYKVTASVDKLPEIKPGMTANMTILVGEKSNVLAIPQRAVLSKDGKKIVRVITDSKMKKYQEVEVTTGMDADGGLVEVLTGLEAGMEVVTFINDKK